MDFPSSTLYLPYKKALQAATEKHTTLSPLLRVHVVYNNLERVNGVVCNRSR